MNLGALVAPFFVSALFVAALDAQTGPDTAPSVQTSATADPLVPQTLVVGGPGPRILQLPHGDLPTVGLRLFVPMDEAPVEGGSGWILARLAGQRISEAGRRLGAEVSVRRTPDGIAYLVVGARTDIDYLAFLLREAASRPDPGAIPDALRELTDATDGLLETGPGQVEFDLRMRTTLGTPIAGTPGSLERLSAATVLDVWSRTHRPDRMTLLVRGQVERPLLLASLSGLGASDPIIPSRPESGLLVEPAAPGLTLLRRFTGRAWSGFAPGDPALAVLARLAARSLANAPGDFQARIRVWNGGSGPVLAATGVAFPERHAALETALDGLLDGVTDLAVGDAFTQAVMEVRREWLLELTDPVGRLEAVGRDLDATGRTTSARSRISALETLTPADLLAVVDRMRGTASRVTVR